jgi:hypothetical protein
MAAISASNSATPSIQAGLGRAGLEQARREADRAEANARNLRSQADDAEQQATSSQENVRRVSVSNQRAESTYSAPQANSTSEVPLAVQNLIEKMYAASSEQRAQRGNSLKTDANAAPVVNAQGQATGRIVNVTA